jgi:hypothetical protein
MLISDNEGTCMLMDVAIPPGARNVIKKGAEQVPKYRNTGHVEGENRSTTVCNKCKWNILKITQIISEILAGKAVIK